MSVLHHQVHIISNAEIGLTVCGKLIDGMPSVEEPTPWTAGGDPAIWDDDQIPETETLCSECNAEYMAVSA